jgi:hypothetical protein
MSTINTITTKNTKLNAATNAILTCSSSDEVKSEDIKLELPWDSVDSTTNYTVTPLIEDVILPIVSISIFLIYFFILWFNY